MNPKLETSLVALEFSRHFTTALLDAIPEDQYCHQPFPGANHALWVLGHLPCVDAFLMQVCGGPADSQLEKMQPLFGMHSTPTPQRSNYPPLAEVRAWYQAARQNVLDWLRGQDEQQLRTPLPDPLKQIAADRLALVARLAIHESAHAGQLTVVRKSLGLAPVFA